MILITGATGTNGKEIIWQLRGQPLRAMVRDPGKAGDLGAGVEVVRGDFDQPQSLQAVLKGVEKAFLLTNPDGRMAAREQAFLEAAKAAGVRHVVRFSAMGAGATTPILQLHGAADRQLQEAGIAWTILRPNIFYQNMLWSADQIKKTGKFFQQAGQYTMSMIDVRDIAAFAAHVLANAGQEEQVFTLTGPAAISHADVAWTLSVVLGRPIQFIPIPSAVQRQRMVEAGMPAAAVEPLISLFEYFAAGNAAAVTPDFERLLGRPPRTFEAFARENAGAFK